MRSARAAGHGALAAHPTAAERAVVLREEVAAARRRHVALELAAQQRGARLAAQPQAAAVVRLRATLLQAAVGQLERAATLVEAAAVARLTALERKLLGGREQRVQQKERATAAGARAALGHAHLAQLQCAAGGVPRATVSVEAERTQHRHQLRAVHVRVQAGAEHGAAVCAGAAVDKLAAQQCVFAPLQVERTAAATAAAARRLVEEAVGERERRVERRVDHRDRAAHAYAGGARELALLGREQAAGHPGDAAGSSGAALLEATAREAERAGRQHGGQVLGVQPAAVAGGAVAVRHAVHR
mmetsp:Transcript_41780/g.105339  ORF Transcript_41780/g.105339 Transcript_41780/m.105339 type:complete len:301 (+) Transcript_41780:1161-2063(+)